VRILFDECVHARVKAAFMGFVVARVPSNEIAYRQKQAPGEQTALGGSGLGGL